MSETTKTIAAGAEPTTPTSPETEETTASPGTFVNPDGTLKEGWQSLVPEDFRQLGVFKTFSDLPGVFKQLGNLEKLRGRQGKGIVPPPDDATQTEKDMFFEALGRPKTPGDYRVEVPKELSEFYDKSDLDKVREKAHSAGLNQKQLDLLMAYDAERLADGVKQAAVEKEERLKASVQELEKRWGAAYPDRLETANLMVANYAPAQDKDEILRVCNNNPILTDFLSSIGKHFTEGKTAPAESAGNGRMTPGEAQARLGEISVELASDPNMRYGNAGKHARLLREQDRLARMTLAGQG